MILLLAAKFGATLGVKALEALRIVSRRKSTNAISPTNARCPACSPIGPVHLLGRRCGTPGGPAARCAAPCMCIASRALNCME